MKIHFTITVTILLFTFRVFSQNMAEYTSPWEGEIENSKTFNLDIEIDHLGLENAVFKISNNQNIINYVFDSRNTASLDIPFAESLSFEGVLSANGNKVNGFIKSGILLYHITLYKAKNNSFKGVWNILMIDELKSKKFYLSIENGSSNDYEAYPFFGDNRFTGTWCANFQKNKDSIYFQDIKTGLKFKGKLLSKKIRIGIYLGERLVTEIDLKESQSEWKIGNMNKNEDFKKSVILQLSAMESLISKDSFPNTHSVLISRNDKLVYENYFNGYNANIPHDMKSASKSISSTVVGIAKDNFLFESVDQSIFDFLPNKYQKFKDSLKSKITIESLLTMSSGIDAIDYGLNANLTSPAVEDNFQWTSDWIETILSTPMINAPNSKANYGSANPYLLGVAMDSAVTEPLELFMDRKLFQKLGITNYIIQSDLKDKPYFGGGMYLTPRDMVKYGELYLNKGKWNSKRIISEKWIASSFENYRVLENTVDKNGYGYLWWHNTYKENGVIINSIEARGNGGQYIFVVPSLEVVVVITSGNYRNGKTQQPETIFENYVLPYLVRE